ncbi:glutamine amidotransferase [Leucobacter chromiiresistens]|uniref:GMP synthase (Glutamine-hydrolysing) n=1 Tax=Leucobacter chromiiresistens TaxID=1079994 RepID=A0A1H0ZYC9_9MICO|nr:glutamine amidotransferase [Leucobacter chromiiresistens]SDQ32418.1 GMP synthase (glutamine-hydrolysing) [Leucobacter chromiiresistens]
MKPFLLITTRGEDDVAAHEHAAYCRLTGLLPDELEWIRADRATIGDIAFARYSGIILAGSPFTVSEPPERKSAVERRVERELSGLLDEVVRRDFPFLGVCYGVGTIGSHQGARVDRTYGEPSQAVRISLTRAGTSDPLLRELPASFDAFVGHKEAISDVPPSITVLASSPTCPVQAFRVGENVYATQFHPELDTAAFTARVRSYAGHGYFEPSQVDSIIATAEAADVRASHMVLARFVEEYLDSRRGDRSAGPTSEPIAHAI